MKQLAPHLTIENCQAAIEFYQSILGGEIKNEQLADGIEMFKGHEGKLIHAELHFEYGQALYFNDVFGKPPVIGTNIELSVAPESEEEIRTLFQALSKEGEIKMPLDKTFWGALYGKVTDKYGITWELNLQLS
ncbi:VOC family protein [Pullulanibacillus sp. KACC 23026]|uniref:VOC family protein n=1 Tax=Pullulanibacillus sp. KACC 23026 TaxID=3028315 RepID=UPI0023AEF1C9|nr:VOC family protein [Pullulanibacillus sp. KACC 23026]WEG14382.1 VOC family protein [Pullulanibacillus sp. KACC 23026]